MLLQNHVEGVAFANPGSPAFDFKIDSNEAKPEEAHFFLAVCSVEPLPALDGFCWIPGAGNILREREHHISLLTGEVALKTHWVERSKAELDERNTEFEELLDQFRGVNAQLEESNRWAATARDESTQRGERIAELQGELAQEQATSAQVVAGYEAKVAELDETNRAKTEWALETERRLTQEINERSHELARCVALLDQAEKTVVERTVWAQSLERELADANARLSALRGTVLVKAGAKLKLVPEQ